MPTMGVLEQRVAVVTGGGRGIGRGISLSLAREGAAVAVNYRKDRESGERTVADIEALGVRAKAYEASVDSREACDAMADAVLEDFGYVDLLVCNAGIASRGRSVVDTDPTEPEHLMRVHAMSAFWLCQRFVPSMRERPRGDVVMVSSVATVHMAGNGAPYNMGKAALEALAMTIAKEERDHGIHVNVVAPGLVESEMGRRLARAGGVSDLREIDAISPFGHVCQPEDVASVIVFLASAAAGYLTGQRIQVDGGGQLQSY